MTRSNQPDGQRTPARLIEAVEQLLVERDDLELSLREITSAAGANVAAVNYHFGSKDALVHAVIERALTEHAHEQLEGLEAADRPEPPAGIDEIVCAWMRPSLVPAEDGRPALIARVTARVASRGSPELRELGAVTHAESHARFFELLSTQVPGLSPGELTFLITMAASSLAGLIVGAFGHPVVADHASAADNEEPVRRAVAFIVGVLLAPAMN